METKKQDPPMVYTLGTSQRLLEEFLEILEYYKLKRIIDVRSFPASKRYPHFSRQNLEKFLQEVGIEYFWLGRELGGFRPEGYKTYTRSEAFARGLASLIKLLMEKPSVIICAEKFPWRCHRRFIAQKLEEAGIEVRHIIEKGRLWCPKKKVQASLRFSPSTSDV